VALSAQQQQLVVHSSLRDLFDYYLSTLGERDNIWIDTQVRAALARQLSGQPLAQAEHIWQQYLSYREQLALLPAAAEDASTYQRLQYYFDSRIALQDQIFGHAVAAALFAFDREQDALALQQLQHKELNEQQDASAANGTEQTLLNASYQQSWATRQYQQENAKTQQLLAIEQNTDDPSQRFAQRAAIAGEQQAVQLAALDQQRTQWQQQLTVFKQQVQAIKQLQLSADEEQKQIDLQLQQAFPPEQHLRVKALSGLL
jgi:lipase chaperone LimK